MLKEISIIIPALNEERYIPLLLNSLQMQKYDGKLEIIIVDGGSIDKTIQVVKKYQKILTNLIIIKTTKGVSHQRNIGAKRAKYENLLFIDADTILPLDFINKLSKKVSIHKMLLVSVMLRPASNDIFDNLLIFIVYPLYLLLCLTGPLTPGSLLLTNKNNHRNINGFKKDFLIGEDVDYGIRSVKAGAKWQLIKSLFVYQSVRRARKIGRINLMLLWLKTTLELKKFGTIKNYNRQYF